MADYSSHRASVSPSGDTQDTQWLPPAFSWPSHPNSHQVSVGYEYHSHDCSHPYPQSNPSSGYYTNPIADHTPEHAAEFGWERLGDHGVGQPYGGGTIAEIQGSYVFESASLPTSGAGFDEVGLPLDLQGIAVGNELWHIHEDQLRDRNITGTANNSVTHLIPNNTPYQYSHDGVRHFTSWQTTSTWQSISHSREGMPQHGDQLAQTSNTLPAFPTTASAGSLTDSPYGVLDGMPSAPTSTSSRRGHSSEREGEWVQLDVPASFPVFPGASPQLDLDGFSPAGRSSPNPVIQLAPSATTGRQKQRKHNKPRSALTRKPKEKTGIRKGKLRPDQRAKARENRQKGPCWRCWICKAGCDQNPGSCETCSKAVPNARVYTVPCFRPDWNLYCLVRVSNARFRQKAVRYLAFSFRDGPKQPKALQVEWNLPGLGRIPGAKSMRFNIGEYFTDKLDGYDTTTYIWRTSDGKLGEIVTRPYAVRDTTNLEKEVGKFLTANQGSIEQHGIKNYFCAKDSPQSLFVDRTYAEALRYRDRHRSGLLQQALLMQCGAIMSQGYGSIVGKKVEGIEDYDYARFGHCGYEAYDRGQDRPIPQAMGHQFDVAILRYVKKVEVGFWKDFKKMLRASKTEKSYYELFLAWIIVLCNLAYIYGGAERYRRTKRDTPLESGVNDVVTDQLSRWEFTANFLVKIFPMVLHDPLQNVFDLVREKNFKELKEKVKIDEEAVDYLCEMTRMLDDYRYVLKEPAVFAHSNENDKTSRWIPQILQAAYIS